MLEPIENSRDATVRETRLTIARSWLLHARTVGGHITFLDITDRVTPVIAAAVSEGTARERAERRALLGYTQFLRARVGPIQADPAEVYREALEIDPDCALAHLLLGAYLAGWAREFETGLTHLQRAVELQRSGQLEDLSAREWQLAAIINHSDPNSSIPNHEYTESVVALVRTLNDIRKEGRTLPEPSATLDKTRRNRYWTRAWSSYRQLPTDEQFSAPLREAIPLDEHIALLRWLQEQNPGEGPDPWISAWTAFFQEVNGDTEGAVETYRQVANPPGRLGGFWDEASLRLTGKPHRTLSERDPWAHVIQTLGSVDPGSDEFRKTLGRFDGYMENHLLGSRHADEKALRAVRAAFENISARDTSSDAERKVNAELYAGVGLDLGRLLIATGQPGEAVPVLVDLSNRLGPRHALRGEVLVTLSVSYAQRSKTPSSDEGDLDSAMARLREAVEEAHYADWARIRWFDDLQPAHSRADYAALLARHGRTVGGSFGGVKRDGR
jgi:tetratricopeptide (TPR) repeat protein